MKLLTSGWPFEQKWWILWCIIKTKKQETWEASGPAESSGLIKTFIWFTTFFMAVINRSFAERTKIKSFLQFVNHKLCAAYLVQPISPKQSTWTRSTERGVCWISPLQRRLTWNRSCLDLTIFFPQGTVLQRTLFLCLWFYTSSTSHLLTS